MLVAGTLWALGDAGVDAARAMLSGAATAVGGHVSMLAVAGSVARGIAWWLVVLGLPLWFPDGRLAGPRWRWVSRGFVAVVVASAVGTLTAADANLVGFAGWRNPLALPDALQPISAVLSLGSLAGAVVVTVGSVRELLARWRAGDALRRQQLRLFVGAAGLPIVVGPVALLTGAGGWLFDVAALPLPFAVAFAVLARGLYDLRTAVNRTLVWVVLSAAVAGSTRSCSSASAPGSTRAGRVAALARGGRRGRDVRPAARRPAAGGQPGHLRAVGRPVRGALGARPDARGVRGDRCRAARGRDELGTLGLDGVEILDAQRRVLAGQPEARSSSRSSRTAGPTARCPSARPPSRLRARDRRLLDDLARQLGGVLHARALTDDVRGALERLVLAREEERRRLRRDLHDGLGPSLAGHLLRLDVIAASVPPGTALADDSPRCATTSGRRCSTCGASSRGFGRPRSTSSASRGRWSRPDDASRSVRVCCCGWPSARWAGCLRPSRSPHSASRPRR